MTAAALRDTITFEAGWHPSQVEYLDVAAGW